MSEKTKLLDYRSINQQNNIRENSYSKLVKLISKTLTSDYLSKSHHYLDDPLPFFQLLLQLVFQLQ